MGYTKEQRLEKERLAQSQIGENISTDTAVMDMPSPAKAPAKKMDLGENKQYTRYTLYVQSFTSKRFGTETFDRYEMAVERKLLTNVRIEERRANQLNKKSHTTNHWLAEDGLKVPIKIIRKLREDGNLEINGGYEDSFIYEN